MDWLDALWLKHRKQVRDQDRFYYCPGCKTLKEAEKFPHDKSRLRDRAARCKVCHAKDEKRRRTARPRDY